MVERQKWSKLHRWLDRLGRMRAERRHRRELLRQQERNAQRMVLYCPYKGKRGLSRIFQ